MNAKCAKCGKAIMYGDEVRFSRKGQTDLIVCSRCHAKVRDLAIYIRYRNRSPQLKRATLYGVIAVIVTSLLWYIVVVVTHYQLGFVAMLVGVIIAAAVIKGAECPIVPTSVRVLSVVFTLIAMVWSEYLIVRHFVVQELPRVSANPLFSVPLMLELITVGIRSNPTTLIFWGIAVWLAYSLPERIKKSID